jgi:hypothetical protein
MSTNPSPQIIGEEPSASMPPAPDSEVKMEHLLRWGGESSIFLPPLGTADTNGGSTGAFSIRTTAMSLSL